jgi:hypothetical protein
MGHRYRDKKIGVFFFFCAFSCATSHGDFWGNGAQCMQAQYMHFRDVIRKHRPRPGIPLMLMISGITGAVYAGAVRTSAT